MRNFVGFQRPEGIKPRILFGKGYGGRWTWICEASHKYPESIPPGRLLPFACRGTGDTPAEAYADWLRLWRQLEREAHEDHASREIQRASEAMAALNQRARVHAAGLVALSKKEPCPSRWARWLDRWAR